MKLALASKPESSSQLLARSLKLCKFSLSSSYLFALLVSVIIFIPRLICVAVGQNVFLTTKHLGHQQLLFIAIYLSSLWFFAAILWSIHCAQQGKHEHYVAELKVAGKRLLYVIGAALILLALGILSNVIILPLHYLYLGIAQLDLHRFVTAVLILCLLLIRTGVPILIYLLFYFYFPLIVIENDGIFRSLKESALLVWGHACRTLGLILTPWVIYIIALIVIKMIFNINIHVYFMPYEAVPDLFATVLNILLLSLFIPWSSSLMLVQLRDLELRRKAVKKNK